MNLGDIKNRILSSINDKVDDPVFFTDAQLTALINEGAELIAGETRAVRRSTFLPLRAGESFYGLRALANDVMLPYRVWSHSNNSRLVVTSMEELDQFQQRWQDTPATPEMWFPVSWDLIGLYPRPAQAGGTLRVDYFAWPTSLVVDSDVPERGVHDALVLYGSYLGLLKQWDANRALEAFRRLQSQTMFDKADSGIKRIGHRSFARSNLNLPSSITSELP